MLQYKAIEVGIAIMQKITPLSNNGEIFAVAPMINNNKARIMLLIITYFKMVAVFNFFSIV